ncbi:MAG: tetratricopeptide repeat protein, partial [Planctomycetes bacterium]|nr:tetratricopeptide repeat protein [Planctomycetota bacterium]
DFLKGARHAVWLVAGLWLAISCFALLWRTYVTPIYKADALFHHARKLADAGQKEEAIARLRRLVELRPKHTVAHHGLGKLYNARGLHAAALLELRQAAELDPEDFFTRRQLAGACVELGRPLEAIAEAERARAIEPFEPSIYIDLAQYRVAAGQPDLALRNLERAAELGYDDLAELESFPLLAPLRQTERYRRVAEIVAGRGRP